MWGVLFGFLSAVGYGAGQFLIHAGMEGNQVGPVRSLLLNLAAGNLVLLLALAVVWPLAPVPLHWQGILLFMAAGLMAPLAGRGTIILAIERIGATRASSLQVAESLFATSMGVLLLGQAITPVSLVGIVLLVVATFLFLNEQRPRPGAPLAEPASAAGNGLGGPELPIVASQPRFAAGRRWGVAFALLSGFFFAVAGILRQLGMDVVPSAVLGATVGSLTAFAITGFRLMRSGERLDLAGIGRRQVFLLALSGVSASLGMVAFFLALQFQGTVAISTALKNMSPLATFFLALLFMRERERINLRLALLVLAAVCGAALAALGRLL